MCRPRPQPTAQTRVSDRGLIQCGTSQARSIHTACTRCKTARPAQAASSRFYYSTEPQLNSKAVVEVVLHMSGAHLPSQQQTSWCSPQRRRVSRGHPAPCSEVCPLTTCSMADLHRANQAVGIGNKQLLGVGIGSAQHNSAPVNESSSSAKACSSCRLYAARVSGSLSTAYACQDAIQRQLLISV